ncbi:hypothetical protein Cob_v004606 [Colletotrichum orbiculare MAFF 240422]|uniref:Uncharacterized protein n=1 Tax=Colletotrichum orbiculare (strain 104-T / ATCC 96160 / CBS 514.97 / LARS 414 / MAFF 240422) TaxID=1213857 RepID=A0A484FX25_COLOR|nr:hypothetical protein Cob_v004606 [Colletotrichum orbiculare MAFF 240422]
MVTLSTPTSALAWYLRHLPWAEIKRLLLHRGTSYTLHASAFVVLCLPRYPLGVEQHVSSEKYPWRNFRRLGKIVVFFIHPCLSYPML